MFLLAYSSGYHETWQQLTSKAIGDITHHIGAKKKKPMYVGSVLPIIISMSDLNLRYPEIRAKISKRYEYYETTRIRGWTCLPFANTWVHHRFYGWSVLLIFLVFCVVLLCVFWVSYCDVRYDFRIKTMFGSSLPAVVCRRAQSCPIYVICVCLCIVLSNTYCVMFSFGFSSSGVHYVASFSELSIYDCPFRIL